MPDGEPRLDTGSYLGGRNCQWEAIQPSTREWTGKRGLNLTWAREHHEGSQSGQFFSTFPIYQLSDLIRPNQVEKLSAWKALGVIHQSFNGIRQTAAANL